MKNPSKRPDSNTIDSIDSKPGIHSTMNKQLLNYSHLRDLMVNYKTIKYLQIKSQYIIILAFILLPFVLNSQTKQEASDWENAKKTNNYAAYQKFINQYPDSKYKPEFEINLLNLINSFPDVKYIIYPDFRLREKPGATGTLIAKLSKDREVKVIEKSTAKDEISIDNFNAKDFWYKVEINKDTSGWLFGAGLRISEDYYQACKLFIETFPATSNLSKVNELFLKSDCNFWQMAKKEDNKIRYSEYLNYFPDGIYAEDATMLKNYIDTVSCFKYSQGTEYMNKSQSVTIKISDKEVSGNISVEIVDFSGSDGILTGKRSGKMLYVQNEVDNSDSDETVIQEETYMLNKQGLQQLKPGKDLLLKVECTSTFTDK